MELIIIGSGTAALDCNRGPSGYVLKLAHKQFLLDGGTGTLLKCLQAGISYREIDKLFYTHLHPDHTIDLIPFLFASKYTPDFERTAALEIFGPIGFDAFFSEFVALFGSSMIDVPYEIKIREMAENAVTGDGFAVQTALMKHTEHAVGYRFEAEGKIFVYSGDTDYCHGIVSLAKGADVLLIECSFQDENKIEGHLTPAEAGKIASEAGVGKLILTHLYPPVDEKALVASAEKHYQGEILIAQDFMRIKIS